MSQTVATDQGYISRIEDKPRDPPSNLRNDVAQAWLQGWDEADADLKQREAEKQAKIAKMPSDWQTQTHPNGRPVWSSDGTLLDEDGNRSIFDDVDE